MKGGNEERNLECPVCHPPLNTLANGEFFLCEHRWPEERIGFLKKSIKKMVISVN